MRFTVLDGPLAFGRLPADAPVPAWAEGGPFAGALRGAGELTVVGPWEAAGGADGAERERAGLDVSGPWRALVLDGPFGLDAVGVLVAFAAPLAAAKVPIMAFATFSTDVVLVPAGRLRRALAALARAGFERAAPDPTVRYGIGPSPLGRLLVATTAKGLCAVFAGDTEAALEADLEAAFPDAPRVRSDEGTAGLRRVVLRALDGDAPDLPLDLRGTPFQRRVWDVLRGTPRGRTRTYAEIAVAAGLPPSGARVVAHAVAANPACLVVPCHRAVRADGRATDFRWGRDRKRWLLAHERGGQLTLF